MFKRSKPSATSVDEPAPGAMQIEDVRRVAIVGAGTMGQQIGFQCAGHGYDVVLYDVDPAALEGRGERIETYARGLEAGGAITSELRDSAQARIALTTDLATAARDADLLSEAVPEDPDLKGRVLAEFNAACPPRTIFMTNTSTLVPSQFAKASGRADRLLALHFHLPVWINNLADVMPHPGTAPEVTQLVLAFARRIGQLPVELHREHNGYVFNSMYSALNSAAITLAQQGVASIEDIDRSWMHITKAPRRAARRARRGRPGHGVDDHRLLGAPARRPATACQRRVSQGVRRSRRSRRQGRPRLLHLPRPGIRAARLHRVDGLVTPRSDAFRALARR